MKAVLLLAVLTVLVLLPQESEAWLVRRVKDRVKDWVRRRVVQPARDAWRKFKDRIRPFGRRDVDELDLNQDGTIDQSELEQMLGEREARDLFNVMDVDDSVTLEEFERNVRSLEELEDDE